MSLIPFLHQVADRRDLSSSDAQTAMGMILSGESTPAQIAAFLVALRMKGERVSELVGFARAMRQAAPVVRVDGSEPLVDTCGTGGDGGVTFNISTIVMIRGWAPLTPDVVSYIFARDALMAVGLAVIGCIFMAYFMRSLRRRLQTRH